VSVILGGIIGFERKIADRPAGVRTMSLVSLGACTSTIVSQEAFSSSTMGWDAARVSAAIPSGCGFLGAALIWKGSTGKKGTSQERKEVHGLATASAVWISAAIGVGTGGNMFVVSVYCVVLAILVLRLNHSFQAQIVSENDQWDEEDGEDSWEEESVKSGSLSDDSVERGNTSTANEHNDEKRPLLNNAKITSGDVHSGVSDSRTLPSLQDVTRNNEETPNRSRTSYGSSLEPPKEKVCMSSARKIPRSKSRVDFFE